MALLLKLCGFRGFYLRIDTILTQDDVVGIRLFAAINSRSVATISTNLILLPLVVIFKKITLVRIGFRLREKAN